MSDFLPIDYKVPSKGDNYMKFSQGDNRFRIMSQPILGNEWWEETAEGAKKPIRVKMGQAVPIEHAESCKHFWAMAIYNYDLKQFQILELTQKGIQKTIKNLAQDNDWGSPLEYDLVVTKTGEKLETEYEVKPKPKKPVEKEIQDEYKNLNVNLEALFSGEDPFALENIEFIDDQR